jgi:peptide-methionine (R)-S-oxide reductase
MANTINKTSHEWQAQLTPEQYRVTREHGTEPAFSGEYDKHYTVSTDAYAVVRTCFIPTTNTIPEAVGRVFTSRCTKRILVYPRIAAG